MEIPYIFHPQLVMRTPARPFTADLNGFDPDVLLQDKAFTEALYLASPALLEALFKYRDGRLRGEKDVADLFRSLGKYFLRMSTRCTPFGLFSGCSLAAWGDSASTPIVRGTPIRHTRFDMHYLCALAQHLNRLPFIRENVSYFPNSSWYRIGDEIRYVEYTNLGGRRHHLISSVSASDELVSILGQAAGGLRIAVVVALLTGEGFDAEEARAFAEDLVDAQLLISELEPAVTGDEFLGQVKAVLDRIDAGDCEELTVLRARLCALEALLARLDTEGVNATGAYEEIIALVKELGVPFDAAKLFQTDVFHAPTESHLNASLQDRLLEALDVVNHLNTRQENRNLQSFMKRFYERYEDREMPLLEVLDTETGIGYLNNQTGDILPLVDDILDAGRPTEEMLLSWTPRDAYLAGKLSEATAAGAYSIELQRGEMTRLKSDWEQLPPSISVMFRLLQDGRLFFENAGGSSAVNLLGRFAHGSDAIHALVGEIVSAEDAANPDVVFAEVAHLPDARIGNVLLHPAFRRHEIPFLSRPSVAENDRICLQDLFISVRNDRLILRSAKLDRQIIPRLSTAHNYTHRALPIYQFLCDLQLQGKQGGILFQWGALEGQFVFLPRVTVGDVVVSPAQWNLVQKDLEGIQNSKGSERQAAVTALRTYRRLPALVVLSDGDNELLVNLDDDRMTDIWLDAVKNRPSFILKEFLGGAGAVVCGNEGKPLCNQFIAALVKKDAAYPKVIFPGSSAAAGGPRQRFSVGSEWVYFKLFCGARTADRILVSAVQPLMTALLNERVIDKFFFIRYNDPSFHLRLRLHLTQLAQVGPVMERMGLQLEPFEQQGFIWKVQLDTYQRELSRYGASSISLTEDMFFIDSLATLEMLGGLESVRGERETAGVESVRRKGEAEGPEAIRAEGETLENIRWLWVLRSIDQWLDCLGLKGDAKLAIAQHLADFFQKEFHAGKNLRSLLSDKYRLHKKAISGFLDRTGDAGSAWRPLLDGLKRRDHLLTPVALRLNQLAAEGRLEVALPELIYSHIHMMVNRVVTSEPRLHELVLYEMLHTWYKSVIAREKYGKNNAAVSVL